MPNISEHRAGSDRRRQARGGRRSGDSGSFAPLVMLIGEDGRVTDMAETVLAKLRFAVTTTRSVDDALRVMPGLRPDIVVAEAAAGDRLRQGSSPPTVVELTEEMRGDTEALVKAIRRALREHPPGPPA
jgi:hypothetical protein